MGYYTEFDPWPAKGQYDEWGEYYSFAEFEDEILQPQFLEIDEVMQSPCCQRKYPINGPVEFPFECRFYHIKLAIQVKIAAMHIAFKLHLYIRERIVLVKEPNTPSSEVKYLKSLFLKLQTRRAGSCASLMTQLYSEFSQLEIGLLTHDLDLIFRNTALLVEEVISLYYVIEEIYGWQACFCPCSGWVISDASNDASNRKFFETPSYPQTAAEAETFVCSLFRTTLYRTLFDYVNSLKLD